MNKNLIGKRIRAEKAKIIEMYKADTFVIDIANKYGVVESSIHRYLRLWGIPVKRKKHEHRERKVKKVKRKFSPELQAIMKENSRINNKKIKFFNTVETGKDKFLVQNILKKSRAVANE